MSATGFGTASQTNAPESPNGPPPVAAGGGADNNDPPNRPESTPISDLLHQIRHARRCLWVSIALWMAVFGAGISLPSSPFRNILINSCFEIHPATRVQPAADPTPLLVAAADLIVPQQTTQPAKDTLTGWQWAWAVPIVAVVFLTYTPTNIALLCICGAMIGAYGFRSHVLNRRLHELRLGIFLQPDRTAPLPDVPNAPSPAEKLANAEEPPLEDTEHPAAGGSRKNLAREGPDYIIGAQAATHGLCIYLLLYGGLIILQGNIVYDDRVPELYQRLAALATILSVVAGASPRFLGWVRDFGYSTLGGGLHPAR